MPLVRAVIRETQDRFGVKLRAFAVMSNHIHLVVKVSSRSQFANALRFLAGQLALKVAASKLWRARAWSRPVQTRRDIDGVTLYVACNPLREGLRSLDDTFLLIDGVLQL